MVSDLLEVPIKNSLLEYLRTNYGRMLNIDVSAREYAESGT